MVERANNCPAVNQLSPRDERIAAWREGQDTMRHVVRRLSPEKRLALAEQHGVTFESAIQRIDKLIEQAIVRGQFGPAHNMLMMLYKMCGLYVERMEVEAENVIDLTAALTAARARLGLLRPIIDVEAREAGARAEEKSGGRPPESVNEVLDGA